MFNAKDIIWIVFFFLIILVIFMLLRPVFILKRDQITGRPLDEINGVKLFGWTILFTALLTMVFYIFNIYKSKNIVY